MTTTLTAPEAGAAAVEQTRLRALALQIEFVLRHTTNLEWLLPQMAHGLETRWLAAIGVYGLQPDQRARACCAWTSTGTPTMQSVPAASSS